MLKRALILALPAALLALTATAAWSYRDDLLSRQEGRVVIYGTVEPPKAAPIVAAFERLHPDIVVDYHRRDSAGAYREFRADQDAGRAIADIVWNSSMSAQVKLINDGYSQPYRAEARAMLPSWASWKDEGYAVSSEAMMFAVNRRAKAAAQMPASHRALLRLLNSDPGLLAGRIGMVDPVGNAVAYMGYSQDLAASADSTRLYRAIARSKPRIYPSNRALLDALAAGEIDFAYNILGSYPLDSDAPEVKGILPRDYLLTVSRIAFIAHDAPHPAAAHLFLDFLLSPGGQSLLAAEHLGAVRPDIADRTFAGSQLRPIKVGPALLADFDQMRRRRLIHDWSSAMGRG